MNINGEEASFISWSWNWEEQWMQSHICISATLRLRSIPHEQRIHCFLLGPDKTRRTCVLTCRSRRAEPQLSPCVAMLAINIRPTVHSFLPHTLSMQWYLFQIH